MKKVIVPMVLLKLVACDTFGNMSIPCAWQSPEIPKVIQTCRYEDNNDPRSICNAPMTAVEHVVKDYDISAGLDCYFV